MKTLPFLFALICVLGCDPVVDDSFSTVCAVDGFGEVHSESPVSCRNLSLNVTTARDLMVSRGLVKNAAEFGVMYSGVAVEIYDNRCTRGVSIGLTPVKGCVDGYYHQPTGDRPSRIQLSWHGFALAREMMSHYDFVTEQGSSDWDERGVYALLSEYVQAALPIAEPVEPQTETQEVSPPSIDPEEVEPLDTDPWIPEIQPEL